MSTAHDTSEATAPWTRQHLLVAGTALALAGAAAVVAYVAAAPKVQSLVGLLVILTIAFASSTDRGAIDRKTVAWGLGLQVLFALLVIPPVAARLWSRSLRAYFVLAVVFGVASAALGAWGALRFDLPMASAIVAAAGALLGGAALARRFVAGRAS